MITPFEWLVYISVVSSNCGGCQNCFKSSFAKTLINRRINSLLMCPSAFLAFQLNGYRQACHSGRARAYFHDIGSHRFLAGLFTSCGHRVRAGSNRGEKALAALDR